MRLMPRWQRIFLASCVANIGFALGYVGADYLRIPRLYYFPHQRAWQLIEPIGGVPMGYVGLWIWALVVASVAGALTWVALGAKKAPATARALQLFGAWTGTATALALAYFTWNNWP
jgi:hypothetical protein